MVVLYNLINIFANMLSEIKLIFAKTTLFESKRSCKKTNNHPLTKTPLREHHPLKQGLRPGVPTTLYTWNILLREHHPLKQGLRLMMMMIDIIMENISESIIH